MTEEQNVQRSSANLVVSHNVRDQMKKQRWSARKAAVALGVQHTFISRRLSGETPMDADDMEMFARLLEVDVATFFVRHPESQMQNSFWTIATVTDIADRISDRTAAVKERTRTASVAHLVPAS